jgi:predicted nucleotidyltransferase
VHEAIINFREKMRNEAVAKAKQYTSSLNLKKYKAVLFGSFARGDFNYASDIDLLIISDELPENLNERLSFLNSKRWDTPDVEPIGWTEKEYELRKKKHDPFIGLLEKEGIVIEERG